MFLKYTIDIPKPCDEGWQNMTPTQKGRFCASCQKEVIDFTQLSSSDIARKIKSRKNLCGRFTKDQLQQNYTTSSQNNLSRLGIALGLGSIIAVAQPSFAQEKNIKVQIEQDIVDKGLKKKITTKNDSILFSGTVLDDQNLTLPGANIIQLNKTHRTQADFDGNFSIFIHKEDLKNDVFLEITYTGFKNKKIKLIKEEAYKKHKINLEFSDELTEVYVGYVYYSRPNIFQRFLNLFRSKENKRHF